MSKSKGVSLEISVSCVFQIVVIPAYLALGVWIGFQILSGLLSGSGSGVAYAAHVGGFLAGILLIKLFDKRQVAAT